MPVPGGGVGESPRLSARDDARTDPARPGIAPRREANQSPSQSNWPPPATARPPLLQQPADLAWSSADYPSLARTSSPGLADAPASRPVPPASARFIVSSDFQHPDSQARYLHPLAYSQAPFASAATPAYGYEPRHHSFRFAHSVPALHNRPQSSLSSSLALAHGRREGNNRSTPPTSRSQTPSGNKQPSDRAALTLSLPDQDSTPHTLSASGSEQQSNHASLHSALSSSEAAALQIQPANLPALHTASAPPHLFPVQREQLAFRDTFRDFPTSSHFLPRAPMWQPFPHHHQAWPQTYHYPPNYSGPSAQFLHHHPGSYAVVSPTFSTSSAGQPHIFSSGPFVPQFPFDQHAPHLNPPLSAAPLQQYSGFNPYNVGYVALSPHLASYSSGASLNHDDAQPRAQPALTLPARGAGDNNWGHYSSHKPSEPRQSLQRAHSAGQQLFLHGYSASPSPNSRSQSGEPKSRNFSSSSSSTSASASSSSPRFASRRPRYGNCLAPTDQPISSHKESLGESAFDKTDPASQRTFQGESGAAAEAHRRESVGALTQRSHAHETLRKQSSSSWQPLDDQLASQSEPRRKRAHHPDSPSEAEVPLRQAGRAVPRADRTKASPQGPPGFSERSRASQFGPGATDEARLSGPIAPPAGAAETSAAQSAPAFKTDSQSTRSYGRAALQALDGSDQAGLDHYDQHQVPQPDRATQDFDGDGHVFRLEFEGEEAPQEQHKMVLDKGDNYIGTSACSQQVLRPPARQPAQSSEDQKSGQGASRASSKTKMVRNPTGKQGERRLLKRRKPDKSTSKFRGVTWHKRDKRWIGRAWVNGKIQNVGSFATELEAAAAVEQRYVQEYGAEAASDSAALGAAGVLALQGAQSEQDGQSSNLAGLVPQTGFQPGSENSQGILQVPVPAPEPSVSSDHVPAPPPPALPPEQLRSQSSPRSLTRSSRRLRSRKQRPPGS